MRLKSPEKLLENVPLAPLLTLRTGGPARYFVQAHDDATLRQALAWAAQERHAVLLLGGGSNLVCADDGFAGLVIQMALRGVTLQPAKSVQPEEASVLVNARAGEDWDPFVRYTVEQGWAGIECLSGIPGQVGSTPIQNVGAYGQEVKSSIESVRCLDRQSQSITTLDGVACEFAYRHSRFKGRDRGRFAVLDVTFRLIPGGAPCVAYQDVARRVAGTTPTLASVRHAVLAARREKAMLLDPNDPDGPDPNGPNPNKRSCGSFFVNPVIDAARFKALQQTLPNPLPHYPEPDGRVKLPAAWLIEQTGFQKGQRSGNVGLSTQHSLCIVAHDGATSREVRDFACEIKRAVLQRFGIALHPEPEFVGLEPP